MTANILKVLATLIFGLFFGVLGLLISMYIGGNYAGDFVFNGVRGYEATGQIGLILGSLAGLIIGWRFLFKGKA